jgi:hypothetical protein
VADTHEWHPGSFTKNFGWGETSKGLRELYDVIRIGFDNSLRDVPRQEFWKRVTDAGKLPHIPANFFLYNQQRTGVDFVEVDELVFQALNFRYSAAFDKLALFAFALSRVGRWKRAAPYQSRPALWAFHYIADRVGPQLGWNLTGVSANDIERFVSSDPRYKARTSRKLSTNLNYLLRQGRLSEFKSLRPERWWLSALFLSLDRMTEETVARGGIPQDSQLEEYLIKSGFYYISGPRSMQKDLAAHNFVELYRACGGRSRFSEEAVRERQKILVPDILQFANNPEPVGVVHPTDPTARNAIPRVCAVLAHYVARFDTFDLDELDGFDVDRYVKAKVHVALDDLRQKGIKPTMSAEEVLSLTREG